MRVVIAGGHGQIALKLERLLADAGHAVIGLIRDPSQVADLSDAGAKAHVMDLERASISQMTDAVRGADAVVFAAGGGTDGNAERKTSVDQNAAILLADAAESAGVRRYVMVSSMGTDQADPDSDDIFQVYLRAKHAADRDLQSRDLDWTIVKPGRLTDDEPTGQVQVGSLDRGAIPRADVARTLAEVLTSSNTYRKTFDLLAGETPIAEAVAAL